jgi:hypothetical protein
MNLLNITVYLRNDSGQKIDIGDLKIKKDETALIFDTINYSDTASLNLIEVVANIAVFNENIGNGGLVMVYDLIDQTPDEAWAVFHQIVSFDPNSNNNVYSYIQSISGIISSGTDWQQIKSFSQAAQIINMKVYNSETSRYSTISICLYNSQTLFAFTNSSTEYSDTTLTLNNGIDIRFQMVSGVLFVSLQQQATSYNYVLSWQTEYSYPQYNIATAYSSIAIGSSYTDISTISIDTDTSDIFTAYIGKNNKLSKSQISYKNVSGTVTLCSLGGTDDFSSTYTEVLSNGITMMYTGGTNSIVIAVLQTTSLYIASIAYQIGGI